MVSIPYTMILSVKNRKVRGFYLPEKIVKRDKIHLLMVPKIEFFQRVPF